MDNSLHELGQPYDLDRLSYWLDYFKPDKGSKAFSYFSIVGKNYLILYNNNNYKKKKQKVRFNIVVETNPNTKPHLLYL